MEIFILFNPSIILNWFSANAANGTDGDTEALESANVNLDVDGGANAGNAGTNTTNSEATRAQGDETGIEPDPEATEHDISTANESIDPNSESQLHVRFLFYPFRMYPNADA